MTFDSIAVLYVFDENGQLVSWFFHPETSKLVERQQDAERAGFKTQVREYGRRDPKQAWIGGLVAGALAAGYTQENKTDLWALAHRAELGTAFVADPAVRHALSLFDMEMEEK